MKSNKSFSLEQLQTEIQPLMNEILNNSPQLKNVLEKYEILEAVEIQLKLKTNKLGMEEIELRNSNQSQTRLNISQLSVQEFSAACMAVCATCGTWRPCGDCPANPDEC